MMRPAFLKQIRAAPAAFLHLTLVLQNSRNLDLAPDGVALARLPSSAQVTLSWPPSRGWLCSGRKKYVPNAGYDDHDKSKSFEWDPILDWNGVQQERLCPGPPYYEDEEYKSYYTYTADWAELTVIFGNKGPYPSTGNDGWYVVPATNPFEEKKIALAKRGRSWQDRRAAHEHFVPAKLCSSGYPERHSLYFRGYNNLDKVDFAARGRVEKVLGGQSLTFVYSIAQGHFEAVEWKQGEWRNALIDRGSYVDVYITKDDADIFGKPLQWDMLEAEPICHFNPEEALERFSNSWKSRTWSSYGDFTIPVPCTIPRRKKGQHILYSVWVGADHGGLANFGCADVLVDSSLANFEIDWEDFKKDRLVSVSEEKSSRLCRGLQPSTCVPEYYFWESLKEEELRSLGLETLEEGQSVKNKCSAFGVDHEAEDVPECKPGQRTNVDDEDVEDDDTKKQGGVVTTKNEELENSSMTLCSEDPKISSIQTQLTELREEILTQLTTQQAQQEQTTEKIVGQLVDNKWDSKQWLALVATDQAQQMEQQTLEIKSVVGQEAAKTRTQLAAAGEEIMENHETQLLGSTTEITKHLSEKTREMTSAVKREVAQLSQDLSDSVERQGVQVQTSTKKSLMCQTKNIQKVLIEEQLSVGEEESSSKRKKDSETLVR